MAQCQKNQLPASLAFSRARTATAGWVPHHGHSWLSKSVGYGRLLALTVVLAILGAGSAGALVTSYDVYILSVMPKASTGPDNTTLDIQLAWREGSGAQKATVELRDGAGDLVVAQDVVSPAGANGGAPSFEVQLPGAFKDVAAHGWTYWLEIRRRNSSVLLTDPFPLSIQGCAGAWTVIPGLATDAAILSRDLSDALDGYEGKLQTLATAHPELACEIRNLEDQLDVLAPQVPVGQPLCQWTASVYGKSLDVSFKDFGLSGAYYMGVESGASHCFSSRAQGPGSPAPPSSGRHAVMSFCEPEGLGRAATRLRIRTLCRDADQTFGATSCGGVLSYDTEIRAIAKAHLHQAFDGFSRTCGSENVELRVDGSVIGSVLAKALHFGEAGQPDGVDVENIGSFTTSSEPPSLLSLLATGGAQSANPTGADTFAEYGNWFEVDATATSSCTVQEETMVHFEAAPFLAVRQNFAIALLSRNQGSGIKEPDW